MFVYKFPKLHGRQGTYRKEMVLPLKTIQSSLTTLLTWGNLILLLLLASSPGIAFSGTLVTSLPGYDGDLPFTLETGYISVESTEFFYYFIESQGNPQEDPLFLWLAGGPGCSSLFGLLYESGPIEFDIDNYTGGIPNFKDVPYAWTKTASIIFLDSPVGTGFTYSTTQEGWYSSDTEAAEQAYQFLRKWLDEHPQFLPVQLFVGGDSYSGLVVPQIVKKIIDSNIEAGGDESGLNIKGYLLGSPQTNTYKDYNTRVTFAYRMGMITDEVYEDITTYCNSTYYWDTDPSVTECVTALATYHKCVKDLNKNNFLEPKCTYASPNSDGARRSTQESSDFIFSPPRIPDLWCRNFNYALSYAWANDKNVRQALNVRERTVNEWQRCNKSLAYTKDLQDVFSIHKYLSQHHLNVLVESGDRDMVIPMISTQKWIKDLNVSIVNDWRPWFLDGQVGGYTRKYSHDYFRLTFASVKGAGHVAPEYNRRGVYEMFRRWVHWYPI